MTADFILDIRKNITIFNCDVGDVKIQCNTMVLVLMITKDAISLSALPYEI